VNTVQKVHMLNQVDAPNVRRATTTSKSRAFKAAKNKKKAKYLTLHFSDATCSGQPPAKKLELRLHEAPKLDIGKRGFVRKNQNKHNVIAEFSKED